MKGLITLSVLFLASVISATPIARNVDDISPLVEIEDVQFDDPKHRWSLIPDGDGKLHLIDLNTYQADEPERIQAAWNAENDVFFVLATIRNRNGARVNIDANQIRNNGFNAGAPVRFIIHGWNNNQGSDVNTLIRNAYLNRGDFNVFIVDWGAGAQTIDYASARWRIESVGNVVARMINHLISNGLTNHARVTIIGHSLGGHTAGIAAKRVSGGRVQTVIGLDPAGPLFNVNSPNERIDRNDGNYVEIHHTNGWTLGFGEPLGQADFFPNYGRSQPGCGVDLVGTCAHSRAPAYFAESINSNNFVATRCANFDEVNNGRCSQQSGGHRMGGEPSNNGLSGIFYLQTNSNSPFARG